jgi:RNA polymerase sigma factor (sigma-70 family)
MTRPAIDSLTLTVSCDHLRHMAGEERADWLAREVLPSEEDVRNWLARRVRGLSRTDIDDAIQECYARLWELDHTRIVNARAYFFTIARNVVGEMMRRSRVVSIAMAANIDWINLEGEEINAERHVSEYEEIERLRQSIAKLPPKCRRVFALRTFEGLSQREIAERTGLAESTVEKHLSKGLRLVMQDMQGTQTGLSVGAAQIDETRETKRS